MNNTKHIISGVIRLSRNDKIRIKLDRSTNAFVDIKNSIEKNKPVRFYGVINLNNCQYSLEDKLCDEFALKN